MKADEIRALSVEEIRTKLMDAREELMKFRFQQVSGQLTDTTRLRMTRREIARLSAILKEREAATAKEGKA